MGRFIKYISSLIDDARALFCPSVTAEEDYEVYPEDDVDDHGPSIPHDFTSYGKHKEGALATICALILGCIDREYKMSYGWLEALQVRKLSESAKLSDLVSE